MKLTLKQRIRRELNATGISDDDPVIGWAIAIVGWLGLGVVSVLIYALFG